MKLRLLTIMILFGVGWSSHSVPTIQAQSSPVNRLIFTSGQVGGFGLFLMNADGTEPRPLTDVIGFDTGAVFSPDGQWVAFETLRFGDPIAQPRPPNWELYVMRSDGTGALRLTKDPAWDGTATWLPDGSAVVFMSNRGGVYDLYRINIDGSNLQQLTFGPSDNKQPHVSADGSQIVYVSYQDGNGEIYAMNADGSNPHRLTFTPQDEEAPKWSPDGTQIAYSTGIDDLHATIGLMNADGSNVRVLTPNTALYRNPAWSPDGQWLAFDSNQDASPDLAYYNGMEIYVMRTDGSAVQRLTQNEVQDAYPSWLPPVTVQLATITGNYFYPGYSPVQPTGIAFAFAEVGAQAIVDGEYEDAVQAYSDAINAQPESDVLFVERARAYIGLEDYTAALNDLAAALELNAYNANIYILRSYVYRYQGDFESALADANKVGELIPNSACTYGLLGLIYDDMGETDIARANLQIYVDMQDGCVPDADALYAASYSQ